MQVSNTKPISTSQIDAFPGPSAPHERTELTSSEQIWIEIPDMVVNGVTFYSDCIPYETLLHEIAPRLLAFERFRQQVVEENGSRYWANCEEFCVENHVREVDLSSGTQSLSDVLGELRDTPMSLSQPLWDLTLLHLPQGRTAILMRVHHCISDGQGIMQALQQISDEHWDGELRLAATPPTDAAVRSTGQRALDTLAHALRHPIDTLQTLCRYSFQVIKGLIAITATVLRILSRTADPRTPIKRDEAISEIGLDWLDPPLDLEDIRAIGNADPETHYTVNDVLLAILAGATRAYMAENGMNPQALQNCSVRCLMPVGLRIEGNTGLGNHIGNLMLDVPIGLASPSQRLQQIHQRMLRLKHSWEPMVTAWFDRLFTHLPNAINQAAFAHILNQASLFISNLRGPAQPIHYAGHEVENMIWFGRPCGNLALGCPIISYNGKVSVVFTVDREVIRDLPRFKELMRESYAQLQQDSSP